MTKDSSPIASALWRPKLHTNQSALNWCPSIPENVEIRDEKWKAVGKGIRFAVYSNGSEVAKVPLTAEQLSDEWHFAGYPRTPLEAGHQYLANMSSIREVVAD